MNTQYYQVDNQWKHFCPMLIINSLEKKTLEKMYNDLQHNEILVKKRKEMTWKFTFGIIKEESEKC